MRPFTRFHATPDVIRDYFPISAGFIGGTVFQRRPSDLASVFEAWGNAPEKRFAHIVMSLPAGFQLSPQDWVAEFATQLSERGLPADQVPWMIALDQTTGSEHVHGIVALTNFWGRELDLDTSPRTTDRCHIRACERLGLPLPRYTLTPDRTLHGIRRSKARAATPLHDQLAHVINDVFARERPETFEDFAAAVPKLHHSWTATRDFNAFADPSIRFDHTTAGSFRPSSLGPDFYPSALLKRISYCRALKTARTRFILAKCMVLFPAEKINDAINKGGGMNDL